MRQTWEEIGLDLAEKHFLCVGQLDDREITTSLGKRLLMVLSPFVFLQLVPDKQVVDPPPDTTLHWTPLANLVARRPTWSTVTVDISSRLAPKHPIVRNAIRLLLGSMKFDAIVLNTDDALRFGWSTRRRTAGLDWGFLDEPNATRLQAPTHDGEDELRLWGLTLGMTLDFVGHMKMPFLVSPSALPSPDGFIGAEMVLAPSMT
jgi:hypothetical protein